MIFRRLPLSPLHIDITLPLFHVATLLVAAPRHAVSIFSLFAAAMPRLTPCYYAAATFAAASAMPPLLATPAARLITRFFAATLPLLFDDYAATDFAMPYAAIRAILPLYADIFAMPRFCHPHRFDAFRQPPLLPFFAPRRFFIVFALLPLIFAYAATPDFRFFFSLLLPRCFFISPALIFSPLAMPSAISASCRAMPRCRCFR
jgi:hypothetical protein